MANNGAYTVAPNIDVFLSQVQRLVGWGYFFFCTFELAKDKDPEQLDAKLIELWNLDKPYWKREKRRRGRAPSIWYLRYDRFYVLLATHGKAPDGGPHPFFVEYQTTNICRYSLSCFGYQIRYPVSKETKRRKLFVRLSKETRDELRERLLSIAVKERYRDPESIEAVVASLPWQWYRPVREQVKVILKEVNKVRRYAGMKPVRLGCVPKRMRISRVERAVEEEAA